MEDKDKKRLQSIREKRAQLKAQEKTVVAKINEKERKQRARRLIQNGALAEKYLCCENMLPEEFENRLREIANILNAVDDNNGTARNDGMLEPNSRALGHDEEIIM